MERRRAGRTTHRAANAVIWTLITLIYIATIAVAFIVLPLEQAILGLAIYGGVTAFVAVFAYITND